MASNNIEQQSEEEGMEEVWVTSNWLMLFSYLYGKLHHGETALRYMTSNISTLQWIAG